MIRNLNHLISISKRTYTFFFLLNQKGHIHMHKKGEKTLCEGHNKEKREKEPTLAFKEKGEKTPYPISL